MIREAIAALAEGREISGREAYDTFVEIMSGETTDAQIAAFITALRLRGESAELIAGCARAMREKMVMVDAHAEVVADIVGTGGDNAHTFNISTIAAIVTASCGVTVAKHGNRSVSSKCGSADVLSALGIDISIPPERMSACLKEVGIAFLFAPSLHPAMKYAIGPRREIGIRTVFNILGPLCNPAGAQYGLMGVYSPELVGVMAEAAMSLGARHMFVVHASDGLDEISNTGPTAVAEIHDGLIESYELDPRSLGIELCQPTELVGGDPSQNAAIARSVLDGEPGARRDAVCLNAAAAIVASGQAGDLAEGIDLARTAIDSGRAKAKLSQLAAFTAR
jgi:anthranilate phosphoribosyltransferase